MKYVLAFLSYIDLKTRLDDRYNFLEVYPMVYPWPLRREHNAQVRLAQHHIYWRTICIESKKDRLNIYNGSSVVTSQSRKAASSSINMEIRLIDKESTMILITSDEISEFQTFEKRRIAFL